MNTLLEIILFDFVQHIIGICQVYNLKYNWR